MSMQIVEKSGEGLSRVYGVTVPAADLSEKLEAKIAEIAPRLNLKGFRPGKVPAGHVRRLYGKSLMGEVVQATLDEATQKTLNDNKLRPATQPDFKMESDIDQVIDGKADLSYELQVEVMPDFKPVDVKGLSLTRPVYAPEDAEVDESLAELATQNRTYETRDGGTAKAEDGDMVVADFVGRIDGEVFEGGSMEGAEIVLGSGQFIPGFEEQLVGAAPGETRTVKVTFPEDYQAANLAGKAAEFETTIKEVRAPKESEVDDELAKRLGLSDLEALKQAIRGQIENRYQSQSRFKLKRQLLDELDSAHDFPLPPRMVQAEFDAIWQQVQADKARGGLPDEDADKPEEQLQAEYRKIAERRVRLGLVLAEIGRAHDVQVNDQELTQAARMEAMRYGAQAQQIFDYFRNTPQALQQLRAPIYEDKVVDLIFGLAKVEDKAVSKDELLADDELPEGYAEADKKPAKKAAPKKAKATDAAAAAGEPEAKPAKKAAPKKAAAEEGDEKKPAAKKAPAKKKAE
jgi:trigger factor